MKTATKIQVVLVSVAVILVVLLLFAKTSPPEIVEENTPAEHSHSSIDDVIDKIKKTLNNEQKMEMVRLEKEFTSAPDKKVALQNIAKYWATELKQPIGAAYYSEQIAINMPVESNWLEAANRYYLTTRFIQETYKQIAFNKAIECFEKALAINPSNIEAKINLAACYVEGTAEPMKGIGMLREVEKIDSNNINLQLNFAFFSERSGQFDKAIKRFEKVLNIKPDYIEAYLHIADAYVRAGDKEKAIENLKKYNSLIDDTEIKNEINDYINKLSQEEVSSKK